MLNGSLVRICADATLLIHVRAHVPNIYYKSAYYLKLCFYNHISYFTVKLKNTLQILFNTRIIIILYIKYKFPKKILSGGLRKSPSNAVWRYKSVCTSRKKGYNYSRRHETCSSPPWRWSQTMQTGVLKQIFCLSL